MLGSHLTPSLAESWTVSPDQTAYEFKLRQGLKFHNGDPFTAEDVKFSFQRARANILHEKVREVVIVDPYRVRFVLHEPWPDDLLRHVRLGRRMDRAEEVHRAGRRRWLPEASRRARPYKFVSNTPGVELVMEAFEGHWRKVPSVKRLVYKSVPEATTRMAMLKRGEDAPGCGGGTRLELVRRQRDARVNVLVVHDLALQVFPH